jgi:hypothetical protein
MSDFIYCYAECCYSECHYAECHYAERRGAKKMLHAVKGIKLSSLSQMRKSNKLESLSYSNHFDHD